MHWVLHMRADAGQPAADNRVRQALKLATDHQALINAVRPGLAAVGNGFSPVGPAFGDYYLDQAPKVDLAKAKKLLADAGYPNGLKISLAAQNQLDVDSHRHRVEGPDVEDRGAGRHPGGSLRRVLR